MSTGRFTPALKRLAHYCYDRCSRCGQTLPSGHPAFAGYELFGQEIYAGDCCRSLVHELASHIYWWWTSYKRPAPDATLWRYMDFSKLVALLNARALYFARADTLGDPFEGARGLAAKQGEWKSYCLDWFRSSLRSPPDGAVPLPSGAVDAEAERLYQQFVANGEREVRSTYVSCWHTNQGESEAQWRLYAPPQTAGVAVRTSFKRLDSALDQSFDVRAGHVQYIDFSKAFAGTYDRIFWKRASLSHEAEVRAVLAYAPSAEATPTGIHVPLAVSEAFEVIVISPFAPSWLEEVVKQTLERYGIALPVMKSALLDEPFF